MPAARNLVHQYSGPKDLLERLARDLQRLQQANSPAAALDCAITYCCTAWSLTNWLFMSIARDATVRRQIAQLADRGMASIDVEVFGSILCEQCLNLRLCADIAADPSKLAVESTGTGWLLLFLEDGERKPIGLQRFEGVLIFWRQFVGKYLSDQAAIRRAALGFRHRLAARQALIRFSPPSVAWGGPLLSNN